MSETARRKSQSEIAVTRRAMEEESVGEEDTEDEGRRGNRESKETAW